MVKETTASECAELAKQMEGEVSFKVPFFNDAGTQMYRTATIPKTMLSEIYNKMISNK